jgi:hypothetical protein
MSSELETLLTDAPCIVENPWGAQWDGPCAGSHMEGGAIHLPCVIAALTTGGFRIQKKVPCPTCKVRT